jgi:hypothetical protein
MFLYSILTLFGSFLIYRDVKKSGCDPSGGLSINDTCASSGPSVFGALLGVGMCILSDFILFANSLARSLIMV